MKVARVLRVLFDFAAQPGDLHVHGPFLNFAFGADFVVPCVNNNGAQASDNCGPITWTNDFNGLSDDCGETGSATVTWTATDAYGNSSSTTGTFTIVDTQAPSLSIPEDAELECDQDSSPAGDADRQLLLMHVEEQT